MTLSRLAPLLLLALPLSCREKAEPASRASEKPATDPSAEKPTEPQAKDAPAPPGAPKGSLELIGPELWVTPGKGIGSLFFGAFEEVIQKRLEAPCAAEKIERETTPSGVVEKKRCAYIDHGFELTFEDSVLIGIHVHRRDREVRGYDLKEPRYYGTFKGGVPPKIMIGLFKHIAEEEYGKPPREEKLPELGPDGLYARGFYPGVTFEYDEIHDGSVKLAGFIVEPDEQAKKVIEKSLSEKRAKK